MNSATFRFSRNPIIFWFVSFPAYLWMITIGESRRVYHSFSVPELFRTLFAPWKRDDVSTENMALSDRFQVWGGNLAGRFIALIVRSMTICVGLICVGFIFIVGVSFVIAVMAFPLIFLGLVVWGINGL